ncbi:MAG TPA: hypothetical protein VI968_03410 [archaeon]|nr:hypothetical protein [archaeon]
MTVKLRAERWQARSAAAGMLLLGSAYLGVGIKAHDYFANNQSKVDDSSSVYSVMASGPMPYVYTLESTGLFGLAVAAALAYHSRRLTRQLREE